MIQEIYDSRGFRDMRGVHCTAHSHASAEAITPTERDIRYQEIETKDEEKAKALVEAGVKNAKAQTFASLWDDDSLGIAINNAMTDFLARNEVDYLWDHMSWEEQGVVYAAMMYGYELANDDLPEVPLWG